ncbi:ribonuclease H-like domain-containing protein [Tanacetum coccineum]
MCRLNIVIFALTCKLNKSLYGLKQAPMQWNAKLTYALAENEFIQSKSDYSLFTKSKSDLGKLKYFLGIEVIETDKGLCLSQRKYCLDLLSEFSLLACKPSVVPLEQNLKIYNEPTSSDPVIDKIIEYQNLCISLSWSHLKIALKVLRYLKGSPGKGVHIVKCPKVSLKTFMDTDWANVLLLESLLLDTVCS